jgi:hypothetical protein
MKLSIYVTKIEQIIYSYSQIEITKTTIQENCQLPPAASSSLFPLSLALCSGSELCRLLWNVGKL